MAMRRMLHLCRVQIAELLRNSTLYVLMGLAMIYYYYLNQNVLRLQESLHLQLNAWGYTAAAFSSCPVALVFGLGSVILFSDMPLIRENALLESTRCSRNVWLGGRIFYIVLVSVGYTALMILMCALTSGGSLTMTSWDKILNTLAHGYTFGETSLPIEITLSYTGGFTPLQAIIIVFLMGIMFNLLLGIIMLGVSFALNRAAAISLASVIAMLDLAIHEKLPYVLYRISPLSFMRLSVISDADMPYYPTMREAISTMVIMILAASLFAAVIVRNNRIFYRRTMGEME